MERAGLLSFATELLEISSKEPSPSLHMLVVPSNLGIVGFYKDFVEALYKDLGGQASVTAIGHISHGQKVMHIFLQVDSYRHIEIDKGWLHQSYIFMEDSSLITSSDHTSRTDDKLSHLEHVS
ncbi:lipid droplet-associated hydrolase [Hordeum vulgare]|nr:lipid droplet-associated hydrolase [Hordeum vulgare]